MTKLGSLLLIDTVRRSLTYCRRSQRAPVGRQDKLVRTESVSSFRSSPATLHTYPIINIDVGDPPIGFGRLLLNAHAPPLLHGVVDCPAIDVLFRWRRLVGESVQFVDLADLATPCSDAIVYVPGLRLICEVEADKGEVTTSQPYG